MVTIRSAAVAVALTAFASTTNASAVPGPSLWEINNRTTHTSGIQPLADATQIISFCGVDLVGVDLWNAPGSHPDACIGPCTPQSGCDAATWTNYNGGTCWFKRMQNSWVNSKPNVGAASFLRAPVGANAVSGPVMPLRDVDMPGNDIKTVYPDSYAECQVLCKIEPFCFAYTFTHYGQGYEGQCYLKIRASAPVYVPGAFSEYTGRVTNPDTCLMQF